MIRKEHLNIANFLTFSRMVLGFVFLGLFLFYHYGQLSALTRFIIELISALVFTVAIITDGLDGYFARKENNVTDFGKHFDPLSDSIFFVIVFATFMVIGLMPWYFFIIVLFREGFMHLFLRPYVKRQGGSLPANIYGKIKTVFQSIFSLIILAMLLLQSLMILFQSGIKIDSIIRITAYIFFAIIAFLSILSLSTYLFQLSRKKS